MSTDTLTPHTRRTPSPVEGPAEAFRADARFCGPPGIANGGWLCGRLASWLPAGSTVEVTLRSPTPVDRELALALDHESGHVRLLDGDTLLAEARPATASPLAPGPVSWA